MMMMICRIEKMQKLQCWWCDWWWQLQGHLSGKLERHFTHDACPTFHNTTAKVDITMIIIIVWMDQIIWNMIKIKQACRDMVKEWDRRDASRRKALSQLQTKSPMPNASRFAKELRTRSRFLICLSFQWAEGVFGEGEAGASSEGRTDESRRRRRHSCHREGDESQGDNHPSSILAAFEEAVNPGFQKWLP